MNDKHICFTCQEMRKRIVGNFIETDCDLFDATRQQVDGNVTECDGYVFDKDLEKEIEQCQ